MSYEKAMRRRNGHVQPILGMPFDGLQEGEHIESHASIAKRTATGYNVRVRQNSHDEFIQISEELDSEDDAVWYIRNNDIESQYKWVRIYSTEGMHVSGW